MPLKLTQDWYAIHILLYTFWRNEQIHTHIYGLFIFSYKAARIVVWICIVPEGIFWNIFSQDDVRIFNSYLDDPPHVS